MQRVVAQAHTYLAVQSLILRVRERDRAVVDVEQDHVELRRRAFDGFEYVTQHHRAARVIERVVVERPPSACGSSSPTRAPALRP